MDKLVADLIKIEESATESMEELKAEHSAAATRTAEKKTRRTMELRRKSDRAIQAFKLEAEERTQARLEEIEQAHQFEMTRLTQTFSQNTEAWRKTWARKVLGLGT